MAPGEQVRHVSARVSTGLTQLKNGLVARVVLGAAVLVLVAPTTTSASPFGAPPSFQAGTIVVSQGGTIYGNGGSGVGTTVEENGDVHLYAPNANGDAAPEASFINGIYGPTTMAFDPAGDLWVANENTSTLVELTRAQLRTANPVPRVTISSTVGDLVNPFGMVFDRGGNLWVVGNNVGRVFEYTKEQLATSGSPTPQITISDFPGPLLGDGFDASGDLWVTTMLSPSCPQGCLVEFSKDELALANPKPTVTISSIGGANIAFTPSGNLWLVTGGGPNCFGTPCTNQLVEYTKAQLATSGSPTPAVSISSTNVGPVQSLDGPFSLAVAPSGEVWVANFFNNTTVEYGRDQLTQSGSPTPLRTIVGPNSGMNFPSFVLVEPSG